RNGRTRRSQSDDISDCRPRPLEQRAHDFYSEMLRTLQTKERGIPEPYASGRSVCIAPTGGGGAGEEGRRAQGCQAGISRADRPVHHLRFWWSVERNYFWRRKCARISEDAQRKGAISLG